MECEGGGSASGEQREKGKVHFGGHAGCQTVRLEMVHWDEWSVELLSFLSLLATGTFTSLTLHKDQGSNLILGLATDQAVGQALDSAAHRILGHPSVRDENERAAFLELQRGKLTDLSFLDQPGPHLASSLEQLAKWGVIE